MNPGFTLVELMVVVAMIAVLAGLLLPSWSQARQRAEGVVCLNHLRQLQTAWHLYSVDHNGRLCVAFVSRALPQLPMWVEGDMKPLHSTPDVQTNKASLLAAGPGRLGPWVGAADVYHCPSDRSTTNVFGRKGPFRVRSYSMNVLVGPGSSLVSPGDPVVFPPESLTTMDDLNSVMASQLWVFIDEHEVTIDGPGFHLPWRHGPDFQWDGQWPARRHGNKGGLSFADGHVELPKWRNPRTGPRCRSFADMVAAGWDARGNVDYNWLWERTRGGSLP
jgi:prepilin-type N-terminal cleavage/methylation domain-containing protein/prepilin-type processing-associated H-X9-DG protein